MKTFPARTPREECSLIAKRPRCAKRTTCFQSLENRIDEHLCKADEIARSSPELFDVFEDLSSS